MTAAARRLALKPTKSGSSAMLRRIRRGKILVFQCLPFKLDVEASRSEKCHEMPIYHLGNSHSYGK